MNFKHESNFLNFFFYIYTKKPPLDQRPSGIGFAYHSYNYGWAMGQAARWAKPTQPAIG